MDSKPDSNPMELARVVEIAQILGSVSHTLFIYDFLLNLKDELKYMWRPGGGIARLLFLLVRWISLVSIVPEIAFSHRKFPGIEWCSHLWRFIAVMNLIGLFAAETIFLLRCLAHHRQNRTWMRIIWALFLLTFITFSTLVLIWILRATFFIFPDPSNLCGAIAQAKYTYSTLAILAFWQYVITILAYVKSRRIANVSGEPLKQVLWEDGFHYYIYILVTTTVNVLVVAVGDFQQTVFIYRALTTLCSTRLLLHVRRVADSKSGKALLEGRSSEEDVGKVAIKPRSTRPNRSTRADDQGSRTSQKELLSNSSRGSAVDYEKV